MKCIIPCAGESSRLSYVPKHLVQIQGKPLLLHIVDMWKDHVDAFVFVLRRSAAYLWEYLPENSIVVFQDEPKGLADAILQAEKCVSGKFVINLSDCLYRGEFENGARSGKLKLGVGVWQTPNLSELNKSYLVETQDKLVSRVIEKPNLRSLRTNLNCGMGTYFFDTRIFEYIRRASIVPEGGDFTHVIQSMINAGEEIAPVWFRGVYTNVTSPGDLLVAEEILAL